MTSSFTIDHAPGANDHAPRGPEVVADGGYIIETEAADGRDRGRREHEVGREPGFEGVTPAGLPTKENAMDTVETVGTEIVAQSPAGQVAIPPAPPEVGNTNSLLPAIITLAKDPSVDVAKLAALLDMQAKMEARQAEREAIEAFTALSANLPRVKKTGVIDMGTKGSMKFAKWEDMDKVIRPLLVENGFSLSFNSVERPGGGLTVTGELMHRSGHVRTATIALALDTGAGRNNLQAMGSSLSYGKRYCAEMLLNIVREGDDDDGTKGGAAFVTAEQVAELQGLIEETGADEAKFLQAAGAAHIGEIAAGAYTMAKNLLLSRKRRAS